MDQAERAPAAAAGITALGHEVFQIDTRMAGYEKITAGFLIRSDRPCLVETGTAPSAPVVRDALAALGVGPADLATVVVTHIHLDHAGGVGDIAARYPQSRIVVHEKGARHLADPSRLMDSARRVYGAALDRLFGELAPTPADRIQAVAEHGSIDLGGGRRLDSYHSPGHAKHHVGLLDSVSGDLYVGDAAGVVLPETGDLRPATPPPDFDLALALASLGMFADLAPAQSGLSRGRLVEPVQDAGHVGGGTALPLEPGGKFRVGARCQRLVAVPGLLGDQRHRMIEVQPGAVCPAGVLDPQVQFFRGAAEGCGHVADRAEVAEQ
jgi:glyoxylase-like metal-dependent hydrolase (beta-lactamase superfamily II)